jgi:hypothetical protein
MTDMYTSPAAHSFFTISGQENSLLTLGGPTLSGDLGTTYNFNIVQTANGLGNSDNWLRANDYVRDQDGILYVCKSYQYTTQSEITVEKDGATYVYKTNLLNIFSFTPVDEDGVEIGSEIQTFTHHRFAATSDPISKVPSDAPHVEFIDAVTDNTGISITVTAERELQNTYGSDYSTSTPEVWPYAYDTVCFMRGTLIHTPNGTTLVEDLTVGDRVETSDHGLQSIRWIGSRKLDAIVLTANRKLHPVRITAGALDRGIPEQDLLVSRQHRMLVSSKRVRSISGEDEVLISAIKLTKCPGIYVDYDVKEVEYFHILFDEHQVIYANGAPSESLYTGKQALKSLLPKAYDEIVTLFPEIETQGYQPVPARHIPENKIQNKIVAAIITETSDNSHELRA